MLSSRPPRPTSATTISAPRAAKSAKAIAVVASKNVAFRSRMSGWSRSVHIAIALSAIGTPSTRIRSRNDARCGDVYSPTRHPASRSAEATSVDTLPFPFVPPTCIDGITWCGLPTAFSRARVVASPNLIVVVRGKRN